MTSTDNQQEPNFFLFRPGRLSAISLVEVTEVVKHSGNAPGIDEIRAEMLKAIGVEGLPWLTRLFNIAWESGTVPKEWQTGGSSVQKGEPESVCQLHHTTQPPW